MRAIHILATAALVAKLAMFRAIALLRRARNLV